MQRISCIIALLSLGAIGAVADELPIRPSVYITDPTSALHWTGVYGGVNGGYGWSSPTVSYVPNDPAAQTGTCGGGGVVGLKGQCIPFADYHMDGALAGGQIGFNWQPNALWLVGAEADFQWSDLKGSANSPFRLGNVGNTGMLVNESVKSFGTVRARMGVVPISPLLLYGTAGFAYGRVTDGLNVPNPENAAATGLTVGGFSYSCTVGGPACFADSSSKTFWGWAGGAGAEYAISNNLSLKTEFLYVSLGAPTGTVVAQVAPAGSPASFTATFSPVRFEVVRAGLNFRY